MSNPEDANYDRDKTGKPVTLEPRDTLDDGRRFSPSAGRNKAVIAEVFAQHMPGSGTVLEIGSGTGEHGVEITTRLPGLGWVFTEHDPQSHASISAWMEHGDISRLDGPHLLDASAPHWGDHIETRRPAGLFCANTIHISPFSVAEGLFAGASRLLDGDGLFFLYGPFARNGEMSEGNARFDVSLKSRDARWGVRDLDLELVPLAARHGLKIKAIAEMPANNLSVIWGRG